LRQVSDLAQLQQRDAVFCSERFQLGTAVRGLIGRLPQRDGEISYVINDDKKAAQIYGEQAWFEQAMESLLTRLAEGCPPKGRVRIDLRQTGDFVSIFAFAGSAPANTAAYCPSCDRQSTLRQPANLQMEICRRIIELHGGQLKIKMLGDGSEGDLSRAIESFSIALPTSLPTADRSLASCAECRITYQSLQYAEDLAALMGERASQENSA
jgi:hypothetical protein